MSYGRDEGWKVSNFEKVCRAKPEKCQKYIYHVIYVEQEAWGLVGVSFKCNQYPNFAQCEGKTYVSAPLPHLVWDFSCSHKHFPQETLCIDTKKRKKCYYSVSGMAKAFPLPGFTRVRLGSSALVKPLALSAVKTERKQKTLHRNLVWNYVSSSLILSVPKISMPHVLSEDEGSDATLPFQQSPIMICYSEVQCLQ